MRLRVRNPNSADLAAYTIGGTSNVRIHSITGVDPVKANFLTDGAYASTPRRLLGVDARSIIVGFELVPDYANSITPLSLRNELETLFSVGYSVRLRFSETGLPTDADISGFVEDFAYEIFAKTTYVTVTIYCPDPYFSAPSSNSITIGTETSSAATFTYSGTAPATYTLSFTRTVAATAPLTQSFVPSPRDHSEINSRIVFSGDAAMFPVGAITRYYAGTSTTNIVTHTGTGFSVSALRMTNWPGYMLPGAQSWTVPSNGTKSLVYTTRYRGL